MRPPGLQHVAVVGGGILGVSTATHLAERGVPVTLVTEGPVASGASGRSLSWLNSAGDHRPEYHRLRLLGIERYHLLAHRLGDVPWLRFDGGLTWGREDLRGTAARQRDLGYPARLVDRADVPAVAPGIAPDAVPEEGALVNPGEGWVDLPSLCTHLLAGFAAAGGRLLTGAGRVRLAVAGGRATGVVLADGAALDADAVVLAAGSGVPGLLAEVGVAVPDGSNAAFVVRTEPVDTGLRVALGTPRVSLRPTPDGRLMMKAGWSDEEVGRRGEVPDGLAEALLAEASAVLAGHPALAVASTHPGPRPVPGDGEPVLGPVDGIAGCHVMFTHSGATLGLIAGELVADEVATGTPHPLLGPFRPSRFAARS